MAETEYKFGDGQTPLETELTQNLREVLERIRKLGQEEISMGGYHIGVGNNILSLVEIAETRRKMTILTIEKMGWQPPSKPQS